MTEGYNQILPPVSKIDWRGGDGWASLHVGGERIDFRSRGEDSGRITYTGLGDNVVMVQLAYWSKYIIQGNQTGGFMEILAGQTTDTDLQTIVWMEFAPPVDDPDYQNSRVNKDSGTFLLRTPDNEFDYRLNSSNHTDVDVADLELTIRAVLRAE